MNLEFKAFPLLECKADTGGTFSGYASTYARDLYGDRILPGAFAQSIKDQRGKVPILFDHNRDAWIGFSRDLAEDAKGLYIDGLLSVDNSRGADAYALLKTAQSVDYRPGLSIGFVPVDEGIEDGDRVIKTIDLYEVSVTPFPANRGARVEAVKSIRNLEQILRDVGGCSGDAAKRTLALLRPYLSAVADGNPPPPERDVREQGLVSSRAVETIRSAWRNYRV